jgi:hypothetical protein
MEQDNNIKEKHPMKNDVIKSTLMVLSAVLIVGGGLAGCSSGGGGPVTPQDKASFQGPKNIPPEALKNIQKAQSAKPPQQGAVRP